jgi:hypothetical protein
VGTLGQQHSEQVPVGHRPRRLPRAGHRLGRTAGWGRRWTQEGPPSSNGPEGPGSKGEVLV